MRAWTWWAGTRPRCSSSGGTLISGGTLAVGAAVANSKDWEVSPELWAITLAVAFVVANFLAFRKQHTDHAAALAAHRGLRIQSALWGADDVQRDVTEIVRARVVNGVLDMEVDWMMLGDPIPHSGKALTLRYSIDGADMPSEIIREPNMIRLPKTT